MYDPEHPTFLYTVNSHKIGKQFKEYSDQGKYYSYVSKNFYGAVLRSRKSILRLDRDQVVMNVRLKGRGDRKQSVTGIKIDLIEFNDPRIEKYGLDVDDLVEVDMEVKPNIPGNIILNRRPTLLSAYFYKRKDGSSLINFIMN